ncbi:kinase-like protein [Athelia psychrophila]|uniref:Kinase-like protein n=1 Tax=Athelia psychrophila TaxID=1759441 RepID=A0A167V839_9AGAM|nr:kinase-like protein [Fibularhizoctonia sp. CBS 109695]
MPLSDEARHPQTRDLAALITRDTKFAVITHPHTRVYKGNLGDGGINAAVAIKYILPYGNDKKDWARVDVRTRREIVVWMRLEHENVVALLGTAIEESPYLSSGNCGMVSCWMVHGNLGTFVTDSLPLAHRLQITCGVAAGLAYCTSIRAFTAQDLSTDTPYLVHGQDIMHGDLTSTNILIDDNGKARLIDFGLSLIRDEFEDTSFINSKVGGAPRFRALEMSPPADGDYQNFNPVLTFKCDVYSLGSVILQVLSNLEPYYNIKNENSIALMLALKKTPDRPGSTHLTDEYWNFIQKCWDAPENRPSAAGAHEELLRLREAVLNAV